MEGDTHRRSSHINISKVESFDVFTTGIIKTKFPTNVLHIIQYIVNMYVYSSSSKSSSSSSQRKKNIVWCKKTCV